MTAKLNPTQTSLAAWASTHGINRFTAAKWARVGKLPGAHKAGREWLLPINTPVPAMGEAGNPNFKPGNATIKVPYAERLQAAKEMLIAAGWHSTDRKFKFYTSISDEIASRFGYSDTRQVRVLVAKAARLLRWDYMQATSNPSTNP